MKTVLIFILFLLSGCVSTSTFNETTQSINNRIYNLELKLNSSNSELEKVQQKIRSIINSNAEASTKLNLLEKQLRKFDEIVGKLRLELIRGR